MLTCDRGADRAVSTHVANADGCCCRATFQRHCAVAGAASAGWWARAVRTQDRALLGRSGRAGARDLALPKLRVRAACSAGRLTRVVKSSCDEDHALPTASRPRSQRRSSRGARLDVEVPRRPRWRWRPAHRADQPERLPRPSQPAQPAHGSSRRTRGGRGGRGGRGTPGRAGHPRRWAGPTQLGRPPQAGPAPPGWGGPTQAGGAGPPRPREPAHPGRAGRATPAGPARPGCLPRPAPQARHLRVRAKYVPTLPNHGCAAGKFCYLNYLEGHTLPWRPGLE